MGKVISFVIGICFCLMVINGTGYEGKIKKELIKTGRKVIRYLDEEVFTEKNTGSTKKISFLNVEGEIMIVRTQSKPLIGREHKSYHYSNNHLHV